MVSSGLSTPGCVFVNGPDQIAAYRKLRLPAKWNIIFLDKNYGLCHVLNLGFRIWPNEKWYSVASDDEFVDHQGFDIKLAEAAGDWNVAHANDGWQSHARIWGLGTFGGKLIRAFGYFAPPGMWHYYHDDWCETWAAELGNRRFCEEIKTRHEHHYAKTAPDDATYQSGRSRWGEDHAVFEKWKRDDWRSQRERISYLMNQSQKTGERR